MNRTQQEQRGDMTVVIVVTNPQAHADAARWQVQSISIHGIDATIRDKADYPTAELALAAGFRDGKAFERSIPEL